MMLEYLGFTDDADRVNAAVADCLANDLITPELGGSLSTSQVGDAVLARL
jgi:3-isopropylmalate dehydrogenase